MFLPLRMLQQPIKVPVFLAFTLLSLTSAGLFGQGSKLKSEPGRLAKGILEQLEIRVEEIDFRGGTVEDFVEMLKVSAREPLNIVLTESARKQRMPPVALTNVSLRNALQLISALCLDDDQEPLITIKDPEEEGTEYIFLRSEVPPPSLGVRVFSIAMMKVSKPQLTDEKLLKAIDITLNMSESKDVQIQIHPEVELLIAKGNSRELELIRETLEQMLGTTFPSQKNRYGMGAAGSSGGGMSMGGMGMGGGGDADMGKGRGGMGGSGGGMGEGSRGMGAGIGGTTGGSGRRSSSVGEGAAGGMGGGGASGGRGGSGNDGGENPGGSGGGKL